jgi:hypothetical protein
VTSYIFVDKHTFYEGGLKVEATHIPETLVPINTASYPKIKTFFTAIDLNLIYQLIATIRISNFHPRTGHKDQKRE